MRERPHPNRIPTIETLPEPAEPPQIETPVIQTQDVEYQSTPETRVNNKGVKITPPLDDGEKRDFAKEDLAALRALEEFERQYRKQAPG